MKKVLMSIVMVVASLGAQAYDYPYLFFQMADGSIQSVAVESLSFSFSDGQLVVTNADGTQSFTLSSLSKMYFSSDDLTPVLPTSADSEEVEVLTLSGVLIGKYSTAAQALKTLQKGIYIVKTPSRIYKIAVK